MKDFGSFGSGLDFTRYRAVRGPLCSLHPGTKLATIIAGLLVLTFTASLSGQLLLLALVLGTAARTGLRPAAMLKPLKPIWLFLIAVLLLHGATLPRAAGEPLLSASDLLPMAVMGGRILALVTLLGLFSALLTTAEISYGVEALLAPVERIGFPASELGLIATITFRFIPFLREESTRIAKAQTARGGSLGFRSSNPLRRMAAAAPMLIPLFLGTLRRAELLAESMQLRGYREKVSRNRLHRHSFGSADLLWLLVFAAVLSALTACDLFEVDDYIATQLLRIQFSQWRIFT